MYYTYVLKSQKDRKFYIGYTENLDRRILEHNSGKVESTKYRIPFEIVYYEACLNQNDALRREKYLPRGILDFIPQGKNQLMGIDI